jgi:HK97 family phage prohead protease
MKIELRQGKAVLDGYVNAVERDSAPMLDSEGNKFVERVRAGAFSKALRRANNVFMLLDHQDNRKLASISDKNLTLYEDNVGLRAIAKVSDAEVIEKAKSGKLRGWSFGFIPIQESREKSSEGIRRILEDIDLIEVSLIDERKIPAYIGTSVEMRSSPEGEREVKVEYRGQDFGFVCFTTNNSETVSPVTDLSTAGLFSSGGSEERNMKNIGNMESMKNMKNIENIENMKNMKNREINNKMYYEKYFDRIKKLRN